MRHRKVWRGAALSTALESGLSVSGSSPTSSVPGTLIWNGDLDTGDESQYDTYIRYATDRWRVTTGADGVSPRQGTHMARVEGRQGEPPIWDDGAIFTGAINSLIANQVGFNKTYRDSYLGWSAWIPSTYPWASGSWHTSFMEWHGNAGMEQAPFHWGIFGNGGNAGKFFVDLHRDVTGYHPIFQDPIDALSSPGMADTWHDYVLRILWSQDNDGIFQFWQDGVLRVNRTGLATAPISGEGLKLQVCLYGENAAPPSRVIYFDEVKIGTTYEAVAP